MEDNKELENQNTNTAENKEVEGAGNVDTQTTEKNEGKAEVDIKAEAQKIADAMLAKKMKGMPTKEELKEFKDWQESQKTAEQKQAEKEAEYTKLFANPYNAAKYGYIDDVIEPRNTRFRIIRALQQLQTKKLTNPAKKHGNIPL